jgi:adenosylcobinamide-phosphate synthase
MNRTTLLPATWLLDQLAGDPEWLPHPVRLMGHAITRGERALRRPHHTDTTDLLTGAALTATLVASAYLLTRETIRLARRLHPTLGHTVELLLAWTTLAARSLHQEAASVLHALEADDLPLARTRLSRIVGRDTAALDANEISRALIETLAESASDGILSPLFFLALGGVPLAMAFKAVSTLDSMIGHADTRYLYFGKAAARLDDAANLVPARLTALAIVATAPDPCTAWTIWHRDGHKHKSPNAGQPESAIAGALHVRLGGLNTYAGESIPTPVMGPEFPPPTPAHARQALRIVASATLLGVALATILTLRKRK